MEIKQTQAKAMFEAKKVISEVAADYKKISGRNYGFFREYKLDDAELAIVVMGSTAETAQLVVDKLRNKGIKAGILALRVFRPFPGEEIMSALSSLKAVAVLDRAEGYSAQGGPLFVEVAASLYERAEKPKIISRIYGLGGREIDEEMIEKAFIELKNLSEGKKIERFGYIGLKNGK